MNTTVAKNAYSSNDQIRGKAERKAKKALYEYITGSDFGDGDESSTVVVDAVAVEIRDEANKGEAIGIDNQAVEEKTVIAEDKPQPQPQPQPRPQPQPQRANERSNAKPAF